MSEKISNVGSLAEIREYRRTQIEQVPKSKKRSNSSHKQSIFENKIIGKIMKEKQEAQKTAKRKLIWVSIICVFFMAVETVGGYISGSIAIWSDAARKYLFFYISFII